MADGSSKPPKLLSYASALYERMDSEARQDGVDRVWSGRLIATSRAVGIPDGSRTKVMNKLRSSGCIEQITRGFRGTSLTVYVLRYPPTAERFAETSTGHLTDGPSLDTLAHAVEDLRRQLGGINLKDALVNIELRLQKLEKKDK